MAVLMSIAAWCSFGEYKDRHTSSGKISSASDEKHVNPVGLSVMIPKVGRHDRPSAHRCPKPGSIGTQDSPIVLHGNWQSSSQGSLQFSQAISHPDSQSKIQLLHGSLQFSQAMSHSDTQSIRQLSQPMSHSSVHELKRLSHAASQVPQLNQHHGLAEMPA